MNPYSPDKQDMFSQLQPIVYQSLLTFLPSLNYENKMYFVTWFIEIFLWKDNIGCIIQNQSIRLFFFSCQLFHAFIDHIAQKLIWDFFLLAVITNAFGVPSIMKELHISSALKELQLYWVHLSVRKSILYWLKQSIRWFSQIKEKT